VRGVAVAGVGLTPVKEHWESSVRDLFAEAALKALEDSGGRGVDCVYVSNVGGSVLQNQIQMGAMMADAMGMPGVPAMRVEAASASGGVAFHEGFKAVASGLCDRVLVGGVEKLSDALPEVVASSLGMAEDQEYTSYTGITRTGLSALLHRLYMMEHGATEEEIGMFAVHCHEHAVGCGHAQYPFKLSIERVLASPMEADPIHSLECAGIGDGAAAVVLCPAGEADGCVEVAGSAVATDSFSIACRSDPLTYGAAREAGRRALESAGLGHGDVDVLEVHDETTIDGVLSLEGLEFVGRGEGARFAAEGGINGTGEIPTNNFGGLKARGNPLGATGLYQIAEVVMQLRGEAGPRQVGGAEVGMAQSMGGLGSTCAVSVLRRA